MSDWLARSRYLVLIAVVGILASAVATFAWALANTIRFVVDLIANDSWDDADTIVELLAVLDLYLIGTVLMITAIGLYELFIAKVALPEWLVIETLSDLKAKIVDVLVLVIGIKFLEKLAVGKDAQDVFWVGLGSAAVMAVLVGWNALRSGSSGH